MTTPAAILISEGALDAIRAEFDAAWERNFERLQTERLRPTLTTAEVNVILGFAPSNQSSVPQLVRTGALRAIRVGHQWRFRPQDVEEFLDANASDAGAVTARKAAA